MKFYRKSYLLLVASTTPNKSVTLVHLRQSIHHLCLSWLTSFSYSSCTFSLSAPFSHMNPHPSSTLGPKHKHNFFSFFLWIRQTCLQKSQSKQCYLCCLQTGMAQSSMFLCVAHILFYLLHNLMPRPFQYRQLGIQFNILQYVVTFPRRLCDICCRFADFEIIYLSSQMATQSSNTFKIHLSF